jgi:hypothetical protein
VGLGIEMLEVWDTRVASHKKDLHRGEKEKHVELRCLVLNVSFEMTES